MANSKQSKKRARQAEKNRQHNNNFRAAMRTAIKKVVNALKGKDSAAAQESYKLAVPRIDRAASAGIIHPNKAARHKSRLAKKIKDLVVGAN